MEHVEAYDFGTLLQQLRKQKRLSQIELASRLGLGSRGTVDAWEQGKQRPHTMERVVDLAEALMLSDYESEIFFRAYLSPIFEESKVHHQLDRHDCYPDFLLPVHYFRPTPLFSTIRALLTSNITGTKRNPRPLLPSTPIALHGMGGIGKSVMARDLCNDPLVRAAFPDGILWITLGKGPKFVAGMRTWVNALGGTISENAPTVANLKQTLIDLLRDRTCLLILDDMWKRSDAEQFFVGGPRCRILLTTRRDDIAYEVGATVQPIPFMTESQAVKLLEAWANGQFTETVSSLKAQIVNRLGYLPLAIKLAGAQLRRKAPDEWLQNFDIYKLKSRRPETIHDDLVRTFELSLEDFAEEDRRLYTALAIFREGELIRQTGIERLWGGLSGINEADATDLLDDLASHAPLEIVPAQSSRSVRLHDLLHNLLSSKLCEGQREVHQALLDAYRTTCRGKGWPAAPDDGYLFDHLAYHLHMAGLEEELKTLFATQEWMDVRVPQGNYLYDGYLEDLALAWEDAAKRARQQIVGRYEPFALGDCLRYMLIRTSVNNIAENYVPELVAQAIEVGLWSPHRALSVAAKISTASKRVLMSIAILQTGKLDKGLHERVLSNTTQEAFSFSEKDIDLLDSIAGKDLAWILVKLVPQLEEGMLERAMEAIRSLSDEWQRARVLAAIASRVTDDLEERVITAALQLSNILYRAFVLFAMAPRLSPERRFQIFISELELALKLEEGAVRAQALAMLVPFLPEEMRVQVLKQEFDAALALADERQRTQVLSGLAPQLLDEQLVHAVQTALSFPEEWQCKSFLVALAPRLTGKLLEHVLQTALTMGSYTRQELLIGLAPQLTEELAKQALQAVLSPPDDFTNARVLAALAPRLPAAQRSLALTRGLEVALATTLEFGRAQLLEAFIPHLPDDLLEKALESALAMVSEREREWLLPFFAPRLSRKQLERALPSAFTPVDNWPRVRFLASLFSQLPIEQYKELIEQELTTALAMTYDEGRLAFLVELVPLLPIDMGSQVLRQELSAVLRIINETERAQSLAALSPLLSTEQCAQLLTVALELPGENDSIQLLSVSLFGGQSGAKLTGKLHFPDQTSRASILTALAPRSSGELLEQALNATLALGYDLDRSRILEAIAPSLTVEQRLRAIKRQMAAIQTETDVTKVEHQFISTIPLLTNEMHEPWLKLAITFATEWQKVSILVTLAPHLRGEFQERAMDAALTLKDEEQRGQILATLIPRLEGELLKRAMNAVLALSSARSRAYASIETFPFILDQDSWLLHIQAALVDSLFEVRDWPRQAIFKDCLRKRLFRQPFLSSEVVRTFAVYIEEISLKWHWL